VASFEVMFCGAAAGELDALGPRRSGMLATALGTRAFAYGQAEASKVASGGLVMVHTPRSGAPRPPLVGPR
jgi:hypothetical protein